MTLPSGVTPGYTILLRTFKTIFSRYYFCTVLVGNKEDTILFGGSFEEMCGCLGYTLTIAVKYNTQAERREEKNNACVHAKKMAISMTEHI